MLHTFDEFNFKSRLKGGICFLSPLVLRPFCKCGCLSEMAAAIVTIGLVKCCFVEDVLRGVTLGAKGTFLVLLLTAVHKGFNTQA